MRGVGDCIIAGHLGSHFVVRRSFVSVLAEVWTFAALREGEVATLSAAVRAELLCAAPLCLIAAGHVGQGFSDVAFVSDASSRVFSVVQAFLTVEETRDLGRWREKWRFREAVEANSGPVAAFLASELVEPHPLASDLDAWVEAQMSHDVSSKYRRPPLLA
jgi:hypothetical protein